MQMHTVLLDKAYTRVLKLSQTLGVGPTIYKGYMADLFHLVTLISIKYIHRPISKVMYIFT